MAKFQSPLLGYNNNVRHRGRIFHIQTEDSGVNHPHIITHLFMDGGRILKSVKKSYAEHVGSDGMSEIVRGLMKEQHKSMFIALRDGHFDNLFDGTKKTSDTALASSVPSTTAPSSAGAPSSRAAPRSADGPSSRAAPTSAGATPASVTPPDPEPTARSLPEPALEVAATEVSLNDTPIVSVVMVSDEKSRVAAEIAPDDMRPAPVTKRGLPRELDHEHAFAAVNDSRPPLHDGEVPLPPELEALLRDELSPPHPSVAPSSFRMHSRPALDVAPKTKRGSVAPPPSTEGAPQWNARKAEPEGQRAAPELTLDFDALERDSGVSAIFQQGDLPPPPKNLFAKEPRTGAYSAVDADAHHDATRVTATRPPAAHSRPPQPTRPGSTFPRPVTQRPAPEGRYATSRPGAVFGATAKQPAPSLLSDDLVSDKSLDEVILSYLAEDLDPPRRK